jgi:putative peptide zinc metalloprotease protein
VIDQADRNDLAVGGSVRIKLDDLPDQVFHGTVAEISERHLEIAPQQLTNKAGGDLPTMTDKEGRERLTSIAYQATVVLDTDLHLLKSGMRGRARFLVAKRSLGDWAWRYIRQTLNFRI